MKSILTGLLCVGLLALCGSRAGASTLSFEVLVNTAPLVGSQYALDFQLNGAGPNSATIDNFQFFGGSAVGSPTLLPPGNVTGSLSSAVTLNDSGSFFTEFFQLFNPGAFLRFRVSVTTNLSATPDAFSFSILDSSFANIPTTGLGDALLLLNLNPSVTAADVQLFRGVTVPGGPAFAGVSAQIVPEPASMTLLGSGLAGVLARRLARRRRRRLLMVALATVALTTVTSAQGQGPSTRSTAYVLPVVNGVQTLSIFTVDNVGDTPDDSVNLYQMAGVPDGMGAYDNHDGTFTLLLNHEIPSALGVARAHGGVGAFVSEWVINKNTLAVLAGGDLIRRVFGWNVATQSSNTTPLVNPVFFRFCSADLPAPTAFFNSKTGLGTTERIYMDGEEDSTHGWALAHIATGPSKGDTYILGRFNLSTNGSGRTGLGNWETLVANPFEQDQTIVIGNSDGGTGIQNNALAVYVGTKTNTGTDADKAGLTNGTLRFVRVDGNATEIQDTTLRTTNIVNGTRFTLSDSLSTTFSRPEDGAWNPANPREFYFVTTDQLDQASDGLGAQIGRTRLWRLTFDDLTNLGIGGKIDLLIDGRTVDGQKVNMFDNITVNRASGRLIIQEDVGGAPHNGKVWEYDPAADILTMITKHDPARFGDRAGGTTTPATFPFNNDEETSGIIDITDLMAGSALNTGNPGEAWYISSDQAHYTPTGGTGITLAQAEGGQIFVIHELGTQMARSGFVRDRRTGTFAQQLTVSNGTGAPLAGPVYVVLDGLSTNAALVNASGAVSGAPYILVPGTNSGLAPGGTATVTLQFSNPTNGPITFSARVVSGVPK